MKMITLRTGKTVPEPVFMTTMLALNTIWQDDAVIVVELKILCEDGSYEPTDHSKEVLTNLSLIQPNGRVHDYVRDIVFAATEGDSLKLTMVSPIADSD